MESGLLIYLAALSVLFFSVLHPCQSREPPSAGDPEEWAFSYIEGSPEGPQRWGDLRQEWATCKTGTMQSPLNLRRGEAKVQPTLGPLAPSYGASVAHIVNTGRSIMLRWEGSPGSITIGGTEFKLQQCHWHSPTEHSFDGTRFDAELHLVHESKEKRRAVVAVLYKIGAQSNALLSTLTDAIRSVSNTTQREAVVGAVDPSIAEIDGTKPYFRYMGSLTTPPCTEGVTWTVFTEVSTISSEQVSLITSALDQGAQRNARPIQPTNGRDVFLFQA
ncbi:hypothetical protein H6P81_014136 [Aristolochia fimbriata]|uniref:Alpha-carbonic anhydrase domain-containing protein n=1 Tax=Aristolochia fimbriata TaxID=158543 RepID=A0AAV7ELB8_ARIFI|nr:hypothetical protein H6P81_014136 [Aristolochia fimbriata]